MAEENATSKETPASGENKPGKGSPAAAPAKEAAAEAPRGGAKAGAREGKAPKGQKGGGAQAAAGQGEAPHGGAKAGAKGDAGAKEGKAAPAGEVPAAPAKPVEMIGGVAKQPTAEDLLKEELGTIKVRKAKGSKNVVSGVANVLASFNNTIVSITDLKGQVIAWSSAGKCNFRGSRKSTAYAAQIIAQDAARNAMSHGLKDIVIRVSGPGLGRDSAIRALQAIGLEVTSIVDVTPIPHNGCRPRKRRRV